MKKIVSSILMSIGITGGMLLCPVIFISEGRLWSAGIAMFIGLVIYVIGCTLAKKRE